MAKDYSLVNILISLTVLAKVKLQKIDVSGLARSDDNFPCNGIKINKIWCQTSGMAVDLYWVGDPTPANDALIVTLPEDQLYDVPYDTFWRTNL